MNGNRIKSLYKKEIMDVLRDKKTVLVMILLPVLLYPLIFLVAMQVVTLISMQAQEKTYTVAFENFEPDEYEDIKDVVVNDPYELKYKFELSDSNNPKQDMMNETLSVYVSKEEKDGQILYVINHLSSVTDSSTASSMLKEILDQYITAKIEDNVSDMGLDVQATLYPIATKETDLSSNEKVVGNLLGGILPFLLITSIIMGALSPAIDTTAGEKERGTLETLLTLPIHNTDLIMSKFLSVATIAIVSVLLNLLSMGGIAAYMYATISAFSDTMQDFNVSTFIPAILISALCIFAFSLFVSAIVMCVCAFAKSFKEANNYVTPLMLVIMFTGYIGFIPNVELTPATAAIPVANICLLMKALLVFKYDFTLIVIVLITNIAYAFLSILLLSKIYSSESILFGESFSDINLFEKRKNIKKGSTPSVSEAILISIVVILLTTYLGSLVQINNLVLGLIATHLFIALIPIIAAFYIKGNIKKIFFLSLPKGREMLATVFMVIAAIGIVTPIGAVLSALFPSNVEAVNESFMMIFDDLSFLPALLLIAVMPAVSEELMFRGYLFTAFSKKKREWFAILMTSLIFAVYHMSLIRLLTTGLLGILLAYVISKTKSIITSSFIHFCNNGFAVFLTYYGSQFSFLDVENAGTITMLVMFLIGLVALLIGVLLLSHAKINRPAFIKW